MINTYALDLRGNPTQWGVTLPARVKGELRAAVGYVKRPISNQTAFITQENLDHWARRRAGWSLGTRCWNDTSYGTQGARPRY